MNSTRPVRTAVTKQKLFDAALRLMGDRGPAEVTVDQIAAEAHVAKGSVYYNFGSKDGLVDELLRHGVALLAGKLREAEREADPFDAVDRLVDEAVTFFGEYPAFAQLLLSEMWRTPGHWHDTLTLLRDDIMSIFKQVIRRLDDAGHLPPGAEADTAAAGLFGTLVVVTLDWLAFRPERTKEQVRDSVLSLVRGVTGRPRDGTDRAPAGIPGSG
jgi:TetR/AcrR family transcriptional regulator